MEPGENHGASLVAATVTMLILSSIAVAARCYTMAALIKRFKIEDYLAVVTLFFYLLFTICCCIGVHWGLGARVEDVPLKQHSKALFCKYLGTILYVLVSGLIKFVVGLYLLRLFEGSRQRWQTILLWTLLVIVGVVNTVYFFISIFECKPLDRYWMLHDPDWNGGGRCNKTALALASTYTVNIVNILSDLILALLPITLVWNAQLDRRTKFSVVAILAVGSASSVATIIRVPYVYQLLANPQYLANFVELANWSAIEIGLAIIASSAATLRPLFRKLRLLQGTVLRSKPQGEESGYAPNSHSQKSTGHGHSRSKSLQFPRGVPALDDSDDVGKSTLATNSSCGVAAGPITVDMSFTVDIEKFASPGIYRDKWSPGLSTTEAVTLDGRDGSSQEDLVGIALGPEQAWEAADTAERTETLAMRRARRQSRQQPANQDQDVNAQPGVISLPLDDLPTPSSVTFPPRSSSSSWSTMRSPPLVLRQQGQSPALSTPSPLATPAPDIPLLTSPVSAKPSD